MLRVHTAVPRTGYLECGQVQPATPVHRHDFNAADIVLDASRYGVDTGSIRCCWFHCIWIVFCPLLLCLAEWY